jgi:hypothetical protein
VSEGFFLGPSHWLLLHEISRPKRYETKGGAIGNILGNTLRTFKESLENLLGTHWEQKKTTTFFSFYFTLIACVFIGSLTLQSIDQLVNSSLNPVKTSIHKPPKGTPYGPKG